jgi:hypothetical protein
MEDDTPPGFITIRTPLGRQEPVAYDVYEVALELARLVQLVLETCSARFYLKDRLDRAATTVALQIARASRGTPRERWVAYREVLVAVTDIGTLLDILDKQRATTRPGDLSAARYVAERLASELEPLAGIRTEPV